MMRRQWSWSRDCPDRIFFFFFLSLVLVILPKSTPLVQIEGKKEISSQIYFPAEDNVEMSSKMDLLQKKEKEIEMIKYENESGNEVRVENVSGLDSWISLNELCRVSASLENIVCSKIESRSDLPETQPYFRHVKSALFIGLKTCGEDCVELEDLHSFFPGLERLSITASQLKNSSVIFSPFLYANENESDFVWESLRVLNLSRNHLLTEYIPTTFTTIFPNLQLLDLSNNNLTTFNPHNTDRMYSIDLSDNPLDCTTDFDWVESGKWELVKINKTLCEHPPHQNKPKPLLKVYPLVKKVRDGCRLNCTCFVDYIWEQGKTIHSKTTVNCSFRNYMDFPDPDRLPRPTDTLYLSNNMIRSVAKFVEDSRYLKLNIMNLYLNNNKISSIASFEGSDWFYNFQILSLRNNDISDVPVYALGNVIRQNKKLYFIDLSNNRWNCDCHYVSGFKMWLLRNTPYVKNVDEVRCSQTNEQIRQMKLEDWCKTDGAPLIEILDLVSITLALLIVVIICKVYYDYWNYKHNGRLPWLVSKM